MGIYSKDKKVKIFYGSQKVKKVYSGSLKIWSASSLVTIVDGSMTKTVEVETPTDVNVITTPKIFTHASDVTYPVSYTCQGVSYAGPVTTFESGGITYYHHSFDCSACGDNMGWTNTTSGGTDHDTGVRTSGGGIESTGVVHNAQKTRIEVACPGGTDHGNAVLKLTGITTLSVETNLSNIVSYSWSKDGVSISNTETATISGDGEYTVSITWTDPNRPSVSFITQITVTVTIKD